MHEKLGGDPVRPYGRDGKELLGNTLWAHCLMDEEKYRGIHRWCVVKLEENPTRLRGGRNKECTVWCTRKRMHGCLRKVQMNPTGAFREPHTRTRKIALRTQENECGNAREYVLGNERYYGWGNSWEAELTLATDDCRSAVVKMFWISFGIQLRHFGIRNLPALYKKKRGSFHGYCSKRERRQGGVVILWNLLECILSSVNGPILIY